MDLSSNTVRLRDSSHVKKLRAIHEIQDEVSLPFSKKKPTEVGLISSTIFWITARREKGIYPENTKNSGKWLVFVPWARIDEVWRRLKEATEVGTLGNRSKVSTKVRGDSGVICVYTYDWTDREDTMRIRESLRQLGISNKIPYKADVDTGRKYAYLGDSRISKYYE